jgi:hypothetical protein
MDPISQLQQDIERNDADAVYYIGRAEHCRREAALLRQELAREQACERLEKAHSLADTILGLEGLTAAESEAAERVIRDDSCSVAELVRLRAIALNHSILEIKSP